MAMPEDKNAPAASPPTPEPTPKAIREPEIKKGTCMILEPKFGGNKTCNYNQCPITDKLILFGMHCVTYQEKSYHASCAGYFGIDFKIQQPPRRSLEASKL